VEYRDRRRVDREISFYGVKILSLSDTVGTSTPEVIPICFQIWFRSTRNWIWCTPAYTPDKWFEKLMQHIKPVVADLMVLFKVWRMPNGDRSFNRNMPTEKLLSYFTAQKKRQIWVRWVLKVLIMRLLNYLGISLKLIRNNWCASTWK
jgi:hypothetical protein